MINKRNIRTLPKDQAMTLGDQVLIVDKETNLVKLVNQELFRGEKGKDITNIQKTSETVNAITLTVYYNDGSTKDFDVPKGPQGDTGTTPNITATVNLGTHGTPATVNTTGTAENPIMNFTLPKAKDGQSQYIHIAYATDNTGTGASYTASNTHKYMAMQVTSSNTQPALSTFNNWMKWLGEDGNGSGDMLKANNLSDLVNKATARTNLEVYSKTETDAKIPDISGKVDKVTGKGLSTNDFTNTLLTKLNGLDASKYAKLSGGNTFTGNQSISGSFFVNSTGPLPATINSTDPQTIIELKSNGVKHTWLGVISGGGGMTGSLQKAFAIRTFSKDLVLSATGNDTDFTVKQNGNVGIGTTNPLEKLDITGNIKYCEQKTVPFYGPQSDLVNDNHSFKWRNASGTPLLTLFGNGKKVFPYRTDTGGKEFLMGSRYEISGKSHSQGGHQFQMLWGDLSSNPEGAIHDGGWGLMFGPVGNPYIFLSGDEVKIGRSGGQVLMPNLPNSTTVSKGLYVDANGFVKRQP